MEGHGRPWKLARLLGEALALAVGLCAHAAAARVARCHLGRVRCAVARPAVVVVLDVDRREEEVVAKLGRHLGPRAVKVSEGERGGE